MSSPNILSPTSHLANIYTFIQASIITILSLIPLAFIGLFGIWIIPGPWKRQDVGIALAIWAFALIALHVITIAIIYDSWDGSKAVPFDWIVAYSTVIICGVAVGVITLIGAWRVAMEVLSRVLVFEEEKQEGESKSGGEKGGRNGGDGEDEKIAGKKDE